MFKNAYLRGFVVAAAVAAAVVPGATAFAATPTARSVAPLNESAGQWVNLSSTVAATADGCEAWLQGSPGVDGGYYTRGVLQSWGADCTMHYVRTGAGGSLDFKDYQDGAGTYYTGSYWDGAGSKTQVCAWNSYDLHKCGGKY